MIHMIMILFLLAAYKMWYAYENALLSAATFALPRALYFLLLQAPLLITLLGNALIFCWLWLYFWLQHRTSGSAIHWVIFFGGVPVTLTLHVFI